MSKHRSRRKRCSIMSKPNLIKNKIYGIVTKMTAISSVQLFLFSTTCLHQDELALVSIIEIRDGESETGIAESSEKR